MGEVGYKSFKIINISMYMNLLVCNRFLDNNAQVLNQILTVGKNIKSTKQIKSSQIEF